MSHEKVIPTAWLIAHCRTFSDIPFSKEIFDQLENILVRRGEVMPDFIKDTRLAPQFEARYKLVLHLLNERDIGQILEIAAGLSPRGMEMSEGNDLIYVETDLPDLIGQKKEMVGKLKKDHSANLYFEPANALNLEELSMACRHFDPKRPIAIVNEGLLRYLSFEEKAVVARNIRALLEKFGGFWITPDISKKRIIHNNDTVAHGLRDRMNEMTGINIDNNLFDDEAHAVRFFEGLGFKIERHSFMEEKQNLVSPNRLGISDEKVNMLLEPAQVFIMTLS